MIPLRDVNETKNRPWVVWSLIAINLVVFAWQLLLKYREPLLAQHFVEDHGLVPYFLSLGELRSWTTVLTHMFMHGDYLHIGFNLWFLHIFGDNVEDDMGPVRFATFYLLCGLAAAAAQFAIDASSHVPMIGASGAIAGVLAAYLSLYPRARLVVLAFTREVPAYVFIVAWFALQLVAGFTSFARTTEQSGGVAFFAHLGGFLAGLVLVRVFRNRSKRLRADGLPERPVRPHPQGWRPREYD